MLLAAVVIVAAVVLAPRILPGSSAGSGASQAGLDGPPSGSAPVVATASPAAPSESMAPSPSPEVTVAPTPEVTVAPSPDQPVDCGRLAAAACQKAIALARVGPRG
jgi:hypothetical protein